MRYFWDIETFPILPGNKAPQMVCVSGCVELDDGAFAPMPPGAIGGPSGWLTNAKDGVAFFKQMIDHAYLYPQTRLINHNITYDVIDMMEMLGPDGGEYRRKTLVVASRGQIVCTMIRQRIIDLGTIGDLSRFQYSQAALLKRHTGEDTFHLKKGPDVWRVRYNELADVPLSEWPQEAIDYPIGDPQQAREIYYSQAKDQIPGLVYPDGSVHEDGDQTWAQIALSLGGTWGFIVNEIGLEKLGEELERDIKPLADYIAQGWYQCPCGYVYGDVDHGQCPSAPYGIPGGGWTCTATGPHNQIIGPVIQWDKKQRPPRYKTNTKVLMARVERACLVRGVDVPLTEKGNTERSRLVCQESGDKVLQTYAKYEELRKRKADFVDKLLEGSQHGQYPICPSYRVIMKSGRTSSRNPNVQQYPKNGGVRECIRAREGWLLINADYDSLEMRCWAEACEVLLGYSRLAEMYRADPDYDPHTAGAGVMMGITYEQAMYLKSIEDPELLNKRQLNKVSNFGFPGGLGASGFVTYAKGYGVDVTEDDAKALKKHWYTAWPEAKPWLKHMAKASGGFGCTGNMIQLVSGRMRAACTYTEMANSYFQGMGGDGAKAAVKQTVLESYGVFDQDSPLLGSRMLAFVHDELLQGIPAPGWRSGQPAPLRVSRAGDRLCRIMEEEMGRYCKNVPLRVSPVITTIWAKKAKSTRLPDGRYTVYEGAVA